MQTWTQLDVKYAWLCIKMPWKRCFLKVLRDNECMLLPSEEGQSRNINRQSYFTHLQTFNYHIWPAWCLSRIDPIGKIPIYLPCFHDLEIRNLSYCACFARTSGEAHRPLTLRAFLMKSLQMLFSRHNMKRFNLPLLVWNQKAQLPRCFLFSIIR